MRFDLKLSEDIFHSRIVYWVLLHLDLLSRVCYALKFLNTKINGLIFIFSFAFALWANEELYILDPSLTPYTYSLSFSQYSCKDSEIWHKASLDTIIKIQGEPIGKTMISQCFWHKRDKFWLFLLYFCFYLFEVFKIFTVNPWEQQNSTL